MFGLSDHHIQQRVLAKGDVTLSDAIIMIEGEESGKLSQAEIGGTQSIAAVSSYKREMSYKRRPANPFGSQDKEPFAQLPSGDSSHTGSNCGHCGNSPHGSMNNSVVRSRSIP